ARAIRAETAPPALGRTLRAAKTRRRALPWSKSLRLCVPSRSPSTGVRSAQRPRATERTKRESSNGATVGAIRATGQDAKNSRGPRSSLGARRRKSTSCTRRLKAPLSDKVLPAHPGITSARSAHAVICLVRGDARRLARLCYDTRRSNKAQVDHDGG